MGGVQKGRGGGLGGSFRGVAVIGYPGCREAGVFRDDKNNGMANALCRSPAKKSQKKTGERCRRNGGLPCCCSCCCFWRPCCCCCIAEYPRVTSSLNSTPRRFRLIFS